MSILNNKNFFGLFWTQFFGALNDNILKNALVVLVTYKSISVLGVPSNSLVALAAGLFILPFFLFSSIAGQLADRYEKATMIQWIKLLEIFIMTMAALGLYYQNFLWLLIILFLMGLQSTFFGPLKFSILTDLVPENKLVSANAYVEMGTFISILLGTVLGGLLAMRPSTILMVVLLIVAIAGYVISRYIPKNPISNPDLKIDWNPISSTFKILKCISAKESIKNSVFAISWFWFLGASILTMIPGYCKDYFHSGEGVVTACLAVFTIGIALGSLICEKLSFQRVEVGLVPIGSIGMTFFLADFYFIDGFHGEATAPLFTLWQWLEKFGGLRVLFDLLGTALFGGIFIIPLYALIQQRSDPKLRSQVIAGNNIVNALLMVVASLFLILFHKLGMSFSDNFLVLAIMNVVVSLYVYSIIPEFTLRFFSWALVHVMYRLKVKNIDNWPQKGPALVVCNHVSFVDWLILSGSCPHPMRFVMYYKIAQTPFLRYLFRQAKIIPIAGHKEDPKIYEQAFKSISHELAQGEIVCIFPEGQLTSDGNLNPFKKGVEKILATNPVPVIPMALSGLWGSLFSRHQGRSGKNNEPRRFWYQVSLEIDAPVSPENATAEFLEKKVSSLLQNQHLPGAAIPQD